MSLQRLLYDVCHATRNLPNVSYADHRTHFWWPLVFVGWTAATHMSERSPSFKGPARISIFSTQPPVAMTTQESCWCCHPRLNNPSAINLMQMNWYARSAISCATKMTRGRKTRPSKWVRYCIATFLLSATHSFSLIGVYCWCHYCLVTWKSWLDLGVGFPIPAGGVFDVCEL